MDSLREAIGDERRCDCLNAKSKRISEFFHESRLRLRLVDRRWIPWANDELNVAEYERIVLRGTGRLLIVLHGLRCGLARFKLCAHFLDLRCLFVESCSKLHHGLSEILL